MTRRRHTSRRRYQRVQLERAERAFFILGATLYVVGVFGGISLLAMPVTTAILLLIIGGGCLLVTILMVMR
ncbi:MAG: hypothetical protein JXA33_09915 [Anaerolineae bacterium]|nr:hypothetical protein [Anaerolineae bacterium]